MQCIFEILAFATCISSSSDAQNVKLPVLLRFVGSACTGRRSDSHTVEYTMPDIFDAFYASKNWQSRVSSWNNQGSLDLSIRVTHSLYLSR